MNIPSVSVRDMLRDQAKVIRQVQETNQPVVLTNRDEPQIALVPLSVLEDLTVLRRRNALKKLIELSNEIAQEHKDNPLPTDMSTNHNKYFYEAWEEQHKRNI